MVLRKERTWVMMNLEGQRKVVEAPKHVIMQRTGVSGRDLRIVDPLLSYPSTIVGRGRAIIINLEHIKAIITAQDLLFVNSTDPSLFSFLDDLHSQILCHHRATTQPQPPEAQDGKDEAEINQDGMKILPFEFLALEACLEAACGALENEAKILEQQTYPALDKLTSQISTSNLESIRLIKSRLVALAARVRRVRDELEHLLDDNEYLAALYLTDKLVQQQLENSTASIMNDMENEVLQPDINDRIPQVSLERSVDSASDHENSADYSKDQMFGGSNGVGSEMHEAQAGTPYGAVTKHSFNVEEIEMLLGAYFVQIGGTLNKLSRLREYVDDTEDYININLDDKQNRLLQMGVKLGTANILMNAFICVTGVFSMNIHIDLFDTGMPQFLGTVFGCTFACIFLYVVAIIWYKCKRLLE